MLVDLKAAELKLAKAKEKFEKQKRVEVKAREEFQRARESHNAKLLASLTKKVEKEARDAEKCDQEYADAVKRAQEQQQRVYEADMPRVLTDLEAIELECAASTRDTLVRFADARSAHAPRLVAVGTAIGERAKKFVPQSHIQAFCDANRTGATVRPHAVYEPFDGNAPMPPAAAAASATGPAGAMMPGGAGGSLGSMPSATMAHAASMPGGLNAPPNVSPRVGGAPPPTERCRALYDYEAQDDGEISFKAGEILTVLHKDESGWWTCQLRTGQSGLLPSNFAELLPPTAAPAPSSSPPGPPTGPAAGYVAQNQPGYTHQGGPGYASQPPQSNYSMQAPQNAPPYGGVATQGPPGGGRGPAPIMAARGSGIGGGGGPMRGPPPNVGGRPSVAPPAAPAVPAFVPVNPNDPAVGRRVRALYDYQADGDDEVDLKEGDEMTVLDNDGGWYVVISPRAPVPRRAPSNFLEFVG